MGTIRTVLAYPHEDASEIATALEERGHEVAVAKRATEALAKVGSESFDCVISAYTLPGDDGLTLFDGVCELDDIPFILFDEKAAFDIEEAFNAGIDRFVAKDRADSIDTLAEKITEVTTELVDYPEQQDISGHEPEQKEIVRAIDEAPIGMTVTDPSLPDNPVVYINQAWKNVTGYDDEEVLGRNLRLLQGPETDSQSVKQITTAIENEEPTTVELRNYRRDGTPFWNELTIAPIYDDGELVHYVGFQNDITDRKRAQQLAAERAARLKEEKETLRRVLGRVNGLLHDVNQALVQHNERPTVTEQICEKIVDADGYTASWIGKSDPTGEKICFDAIAGMPANQPTKLSLERLTDEVRSAIESEQVAVCSTGSCDAGRLCPEDVGVRRCAFVPLVYDKKRYGLLGVYGDSPAVLDRREQQLFEFLGKMIASRLNAIETTQVLTADTVLEVEIAVEDDSFPLSQVASQIDATVEYVGLTNGEDASYELFLTATDCEQLTTLSTLPFVEDVREVSSDACTFVLTVDSPTPFQQLADHSASVLQLTAEQKRSILELELPPDHDVRSIIELLQRRYEAVDLRSCTEQTAREQTPYEFSAEIAEKLTERQQATLEVAYLNGYFEWPRPTDGSEVAEVMGITRQTFHQHLRAAERKLVGTYVECHSEDTAEKAPETGLFQTERSMS